MKNLIIATCAVLVITALNACSQQEIPDTPAPAAETITVTARTAEEQTGTKTTLSGLETHWVKDVDKIGVFSPEAAGQKNNVLYTAQSNGKTSDFTGSLVWGAGAHDFYAYYPYNSTYNGDHEAVPFSLPSEQTQSAANNTDHIGALDYMVATPLTVARGGAVNFTFNHVFSIMEFQITGSGSLSAVRLTGTNALACTGTIDLIQTPGVDDIAYTIAQTSTSQTVTVTLGSAASLSTTTAVSVFMMILPGTQSGDITIELEIGGSWKSMTKTPPAGGFVRGKKYQISVFHDSRDGNLYSYRTYGSQVWMTKNMAYLPSVVGPGTGSNSTAYYYVYGYDSTDVATAKATDNYSTYGVLYNWTAAQSACPSGWRLPSDAEWTQLEEYLIANGYNYDGTTTGNKIAKSMANYSGWNTSSTVGAVGNTDYPEYRNKSGFTALPGGYRLDPGAFRHVGTTGHWWSSAQIYTSYAWNRGLSSNGSSVFRGSYDKEDGYSVRCLRD